MHVVLYKAKLKVKDSEQTKDIIKRFSVGHVGCYDKKHVALFKTETFFVHKV